MQVHCTAKNCLVAIHKHILLITFFLKLKLSTFVICKGIKSCPIKVNGYLITYIIFAPFNPYETLIISMAPVMPEWQEPDIYFTPLVHCTTESIFLVFLSSISECLALPMKHAGESLPAGLELSSFYSIHSAISV